MAIDPSVLALSALGRVYCGLSAEEAVMVAEKAVEVAGSLADEVDLLDAFDDVWAASLSANLISNGLDTTPIHPLQTRERMVSIAQDEHEIEELMKLYPKDDGVIRPKRYKDKSLHAIKKRTKKRRHWDKN